MDGAVYVVCVAGVPLGVYPSWRMAVESLCQSYADGELVVGPYDREHTHAAGETPDGPFVVQAVRPSFRAGPLFGPRPAVVG